MGVKEDIINYCDSIGVNSIGFIKCRRFDELESFYEERKNLNVENEFEESDIELRIDPEKWFDGGKTIISIAFPYMYLNEEVENKTLRLMKKSGFSVYTRGIDYHAVLNNYLSDICRIIEKNGGRAQGFVDSNSLPERYLAYISGVGFIGKNNLIITKKHGSYVFLGEIVTDLAIYDEDKRSFSDIENYTECGTCEVCYGECPTKAINKNLRNCNICLSYVTQKKELEDWEIKKIGGRIFGCDSCQLMCPYNNSIEETKIEEFKPFDFMKQSDEEFIINMNNREFKENFKKTSCGWRGKNILKRNAMIRKYLFLNESKEEIKSLKFESDYLNKYKDKIEENIDK